ncbi:transcriptional regulator [Secundilactobacillus pentosiphilus]|uniref:Transcriptional regulator n=1 Tax=Secundilactobacillus pentosiphilus TaxID=1714682 RepID=A0A1Z5IPU6_9LACO|nr:MarR family transcriptional regulator [Secundilactobacillus pentosiphilus]GAX03451.1 transcriptional regulator [Secundilactobacillus pentosiphilus]GAX06345.1 transcriptional regulator [Secundilactobacillus pentosiphilus]
MVENIKKDYLTVSTYNAILHRQLQRDMNQLLIKDKLPVNITEMYLMVLILESQPISQRRASTTLAVDEGLMTRMVKHLTALGLIHKESAASDKRVKELTLTEDGEKLLDYGLSKVNAWWESIEPDLKEIDINNLGRELFDISKVVLSDRHQTPLNNGQVDKELEK